jgi:uncharacterized membrane protein
MKDNSKWVLLNVVLMFAVVITGVQFFYGGHWMWPIIFFMGLVVALYRYGTLLERDKKLGRHG